MRALFTRMGAADQLCRGRSTSKTSWPRRPRRCATSVRARCCCSTSSAGARRRMTARPSPLPTLPYPCPAPIPSLSPNPNPNSNPFPTRRAIAHATLDHLAAQRVLCVFITTTSPSPRSPRGASRHPPVSHGVDTGRRRACSHRGGAPGAPARRRGGRGGRGERAGAPGAGALAGMQMQPLHRLAPGVGPGAFALRVSALAGIPTGLLRSLSRRPSGCTSSSGGNTPRSSCGSRRRSCVPATRRVEHRPEARLPVLLRLQEDARGSLAGSPRR